jgi:hypothetical protein
MRIPRAQKHVAIKRACPGCQWPMLGERALFVGRWGRSDANRGSGRVSGSGVAGVAGVAPIRDCSLRSAARQLVRGVRP